MPDPFLAEISELITDDAVEWFQDTGRIGENLTKKGKFIRWRVEGIRDGVNIKVIVEPRGEGVITAYPNN